MTRYFSYISISGLLLIFSIGLSVPCLAANAATKNAPVILVMGDSLSAGYRLRASESWVALLEKRLTTEHLPHRVINASISGETSSGGLNRLPAALHKHQPEIVIIELGANDGLRGLPLSLIRKNLQGMITAAQQNDADVLLVGMRLPPNYGPRYTQGFAQTFTELARQYKTGLVPFLLKGVATQASLMQNDGLHPTAAAQSRILNTVWPHLLPLLSR